MKDMMLVNGRMPTSTPEAQGIPSWAVSNFFERMKREELELHSIQIVRNGSLVVDAVAAPYTKNSFHRIFSAAKGVVATGMMFAVQEGYFNLNDLVVPKLPKEWIPEDLDERWNRLTIYHLLTMNTGHDCDTLFQMWGKSDCWIKTFFEVRPAYEPGTYFRYDMGAQYVMNELIRLAVGMDLGEYLTPRVFEPLGIEFTNNYTEPEGLFFSSTIQFHPDALTKLAQFYLQKGSWEGKQLLREDLAVMAGMHHSPSHHYNDANSGQPDSNSGYGFHMWRNRVGGFRFSGGQGQLGIVLPDQNMAVGIMATEHKNRCILDVFFEEIFPHLYLMPRQEDPQAYEMMIKMCGELNLAPDTEIFEDTAAQMVQKNRYKLEENEVGQQEIGFEFLDGEVRINSVWRNKETEFRCGTAGRWIKNPGAGYLLNKNDPDHIADLDRIFYYDEWETMLSGGWESPDTFVFSLRSDSLLCGYTYKCRFLGNEIEISIPDHAVVPRKEADKTVMHQITGTRI